MTNEDRLWLGLLFGLAFPAIGIAIFYGFLLVALIVAPLALLGWLFSGPSDRRARNMALNRRWEEDNRQAANQPLRGRIGTMEDL